MDNQITIADRIFKIEEPTLCQLQELKDFVGTDLLTGISNEKYNEIFSDFKKIARVTAIIVTDISQNPSPIKDLEELTEFLYRNAKISDFKSALSFFSQTLKEGSGNITGNLVQEVKVKY